MCAASEILLITLKRSIAFRSTTTFPSPQAFGSLLILRMTAATILNGFGCSAQALTFNRKDILGLTKLVLDAKTQFLNVIASFETTIAKNRVFLTDNASRTSIQCHNKKPLPSLAGVKNYQGASTNICQYSTRLGGVTHHG